MRNIVILVVLTLISTTLYGQNLQIQSASNAKGNQYRVVSDTLSLGELYLDEISDDQGKITLILQNTSNKPLIIRNVTGCCGTSIKSWPKAPVLPGKSTELRVEFRIEPKPQKISRTVTIESNAVGTPTFKLHIVGIVMQRRAANELVL